MGTVSLVFAAFAGKDKAGQSLEDLKLLQEGGVISILNAAVVIKDEYGEVSFKETEDVSTTGGAVFGAIFGGLIGLLGGPAEAIVGAAAGAVTGGAAAAAIDLGFPDEELKKIQSSLELDSSAIIALIEETWVKKVIAELEKLEAKIFWEELDAEITAKLLGV